MPRTNNALLRIMDRKISWILLFSFVALTFFVTVLFQQTKRQEDTRYWVSHSNQTIKEIDSIGTLLSETESATRGYLITKDTGWISQVFAFYESLDLVIIRLQELTAENVIQKQNIDHLKKLCLEKQSFQKRFLSGEYNKVILERIRPGGQSLQINHSIKNILNDIRVIEENQLAKQVIENERSNQSIVYTSMIGGLFAFVLILAILYQLNKDLYFRKKAEDAVKESEIKYKNIIENAGMVMYTINKEGFITFANHQVCDLTGFTVDELTGKHFSTLIIPEWIEKVSLFYYTQIEDKVVSTTLDFQIKTKSSLIKWVEQHAQLLFEDDQVIGFQCMVKDITTQKEYAFHLQQSEDKRKENEYRLSAIIDAASTLIFIKDLAGRYLQVNKRFKEFFRLSEESIILKSDYEITSKEKADLYRLTDKKVISSMQSIETEEVVETEMGSRNLLVIKFPLIDDENNLFGICGIATDITERVQSRRDLETALKNTESAKQLQEQFLANMSHEIRTPLNGIQGMTSLLLETSLSIDQKEYTTMIKRSLTNLTSILNDVLDYSNIQAGKITFEKVEFQLIETLTIIKNQFIHHTQSKGLGFELLIDEKVPKSLIGDPYRLKQIMINLVGNAIKFTKAGSITIQATPKSLSTQEAMILFTVTDTGIGISEDKLATIFERFAQANLEISKRYGGAGLGLTISRSLVELQGGEISVTSKSGQGAAFSFYIPYQLKEISKNVSTQNNFEVTLKDKKILVVEDNEINQKLIEHVLQNVGVKVDMASHGKEAIVFLEKDLKYDLIILDLQMPVMDGFETAIYIRENLKLTVPIIAMTATALKGDQEKCKEVGINDFMLKPFEFSDFYKRVIRLLNGETGEINIKPSSKTSTTKLFDLSLLEELDDNESLLDVLSLFLDNTPSEVKNLPVLFEQQNWVALHKITHKIKGAIAILQAKELAELLSKIEENAKEVKNLSILADQVSDVVRLFGDLEAELRQERDIRQKRLT